MSRTIFWARLYLFLLSSLFLTNYWYWRKNLKKGRIWFWNSWKADNRRIGKNPFEKRSPCGLVRCQGDWNRTSPWFRGRNAIRGTTEQIWAKVVICCEQMSPTGRRRNFGKRIFNWPKQWPRFVLRKATCESARFGIKRKNGCCRIFWFAL